MDLTNSCNILAAAYFTFLVLKAKILRTDQACLAVPTETHEQCHCAGIFPLLSETNDEKIVSKIPNFPIAVNRSWVSVSHVKMVVA